MMVCEGLGFVVVLCQFPEIAVDVVRIAALGRFKISGRPLCE